MSDIEGVQKDIEWIKTAIGRIEDKLDAGADKCRERHSILDIKLTALDVRSGLLGAISGAIASVMTALILIFRFGK